MWKLGDAKFLSKEKILILKGENSLQLEAAAKMMGKPVFSDKEKKIGEIKEIFGPVKAPYFSVKPKHGSKPENFVGKSLYSNAKKD